MEHTKRIEEAKSLSYSMDISSKNKGIGILHSIVEDLQEERAELLEALKAVMPFVYRSCMSVTVKKCEKAITKADGDK